MDATTRRGLGAVVAVLLVAAVVALVLWASGDGTQAAPPGGNETPGGPAPVGGDPGPAAPIIEGRARSVRTTAPLSDFRSLRLAGGAQVSASGAVTDAAGNQLGDGRLIAVGDDVTITAEVLTLSPAQTILTAGEVRVDAGTADLTATGGRLTIAAPRIELEGHDGRRRPVSSPAVVSAPHGDQAATVEGGELRWLDAPAELRAAGAGRTHLSWAGGGVVRPPGAAEVSAEFIGVVATDLSVDLRRTPDAVELTGRGTIRQAYADGAPQLPASARVEVKRLTSRLRAGERGRITWAPHNDGSTDMTVTRIRAGSPAAAWVNVALEQLPDMCGGESCPRTGGDTTGLGKAGSGGLFGSRTASPIDAVIQPRTGDESDLSFDVPPGTAPGEHRILLVVEGNFEPVSVAITVTVV